MKRSLFSFLLLIILFSSYSSFTYFVHHVYGTNNVSNDTGSPTFGFSNQTNPISNNTDQSIDSNNTDQSIDSNGSPTFGFSNRTNPISNNTDQSIDSNGSPTFGFSNQTNPISNNTDQSIDSNGSPTFGFSNQTNPISNNTDQSIDSNGSPTFGFSNQTNALSSTDQSINSNLFPTSRFSNLPNAIKSWNFDTLDPDTTLVGEAKLENDSSGTYLHLNGNGYLTSNIIGTTNLNKFSISSWIKPDYAEGSAVYTIVSKEKQFDLSLNHVINPKKIAQFSIYDGIKWNTVTSKTPITNWTFLTATYDGSEINIYVNGTMESSTKIASVYFNQDSRLILKNPDKLTSNSDVIIGAMYNSLRGYPSNEFSGRLGSLQLYDSLLDPNEINQLYQQTLTDYLHNISTPLH